jgi:hypothetical protein
MQYSAPVHLFLLASETVAFASSGKANRFLGAEAEIFRDFSEMHVKNRVK